VFAGLAGGAVVATAAFLLVSAGAIPERSPVPAGSPTLASIPDRGADPAGSDNAVNRIYRQTEAGIGFITATSASGERPYSPFGQPGGGQATGTGFLIDGEGSMVTNNHVVAGASSVSVRLGDQEYEAVVAGADPSTDLALLEVDLPEGALTPLALADSDRVEVGDPVVAIGNPFGLEKTVTTGIVSALQREITAAEAYTIPDVIQTDAAINPGNSGGPLLDAEGRVIGVNSQIATGGTSNGNVGIGFAVPSNTVADVVEQIRETGEVRHAWLGISGRDFAASEAPVGRFPAGSEGVLVEAVIPDGPAADAGIEGAGQGPGDLITRFGDLDRPTMAEIARIVDDLEVGERIEVVVLRGDEEIALEVTLGERP
jgi:putative serine protease PepD